MKTCKNFKSTNLKYLDIFLLVSFFISGGCAIIYQVTWQRLLQGMIGVDIDSIVIIVSVFMLGIGVGGGLGGYLADISGRYRLWIYIFLELGIAIYGLFSTKIFSVIDIIILEQGFIENRLYNSVFLFVILCVPTTLMGMTLPILTIAFNEFRKNIGLSVGLLYFFNTLGASLGAMFVPFVLFPIMTLNETILVAVCGNIVVALCTWMAIYFLLPHCLPKN